MPKPLHAVLGVLTVLSIASAGAVVWVLKLPEPVRRLRATVTAEAAAALPYAGESVGFADNERPAITQLVVGDPDGDGIPDLVVCDLAASRVVWLRQAPRGTWTETTLAEHLTVPTRVVLADLNGDGRPELVIACRGRSGPTLERVGRVVVLDNLGEGRFGAPRAVLTHVLPVTDLRAADVNHDGRMDLVVGEAGTDRGALGWLENTADGLHEHAIGETGPLVSVAVVPAGTDHPTTIYGLETGARDSIRVFRQQGTGDFVSAAFWSAPRPDWDGRRLELADLNGDGSLDLIVANGGTWMEYPRPRPWHGVGWFDLHQSGSVVIQRLGLLPGCEAIAAADLDGDGDVDIAGVSAAVEVLSQGEFPPLRVWRNDGHGNFEPAAIADATEPAGAVAIAGFDASGPPVLVTGSFHLFRPSRHASGVTLWRRH